MLLYEDVAYFAQTWGLVFLVALFAAALTYAMWPRNADKFERAARVPLDRDDEDELELWGERQ